jgi:hypothetical protein
LKKEVDAMLPSLRLQAEMEEKIKRGYMGMAEQGERALKPPKTSIS